MREILAGPPQETPASPHLHSLGADRVCLRGKFPDAALNPSAASMSVLRPDKLPSPRSRSITSRARRRGRTRRGSRTQGRPGSDCSWGRKRCRTSGGSPFQAGPSATAAGVSPRSADRLHHRCHRLRQRLDPPGCQGLRPCRGEHPRAAMPRPHRQGQAHWTKPLQDRPERLWHHLRRPAERSRALASTTLFG